MFAGGLIFGQHDIAVPLLLVALLVAFAMAVMARENRIARITMLLSGIMIVIGTIDYIWYMVARPAGLRFRSLRAEHYDFAVPEDRWDRPALQALRRLLADGGALRAELRALGFGPPGAS